MFLLYLILLRFFLITKSVFYFLTNTFWFKDYNELMLSNLHIDKRPSHTWNKIICHSQNVNSTYLLINHISSSCVSQKSKHKFTTLQLLKHSHGVHTLQSINLDLRIQQESKTRSSAHSEMDATKNNITAQIQRRIKYTDMMRGFISGREREWSMVREDDGISRLCVSATSVAFQIFSTAPIDEGKPRFEKQPQMSERNSPAEKDSQSKFLWNSSIYAKNHKNNEKNAGRLGENFWLFFPFQFS